MHEKDEQHPNIRITSVTIHSATIQNSFFMCQLIVVKRKITNNVLHHLDNDFSFGV
jgi:hypothetical protein